MPDGFDQEDPFKKYGGKQVADTIEDPFKKYGGVAIEDPVKKKELGSLLGGMAGNGLSQSNGKVSEKQKVLDYVYGLKTPEEKKLAQPDAITQVSFKKNEKPFEPTEKDYTKAYDKINEVMLGDNDDWKDPIKSLQNKYDGDIAGSTAAINLTQSSLMPSGYKALKVLSDSHFANEGEDNLTANMLKDRVGRYNKVAQPFRELGNINYDDERDFGTRWKIYDSAIRAYANKNPHFAAQAQAAGIDLNGNDLLLKLGSDKKSGQIMADILNDPDLLDYVQNENPNLLPSIKKVSDDLIYDNKEYGKVQLANEISREMERSGYNKIDPIFNFKKEAKESGDATAKALYVSDPKKNQFYEENKDEILNMLDAPSLLEGFAGGAKRTLGGIKNTFTVPFESIPTQIKDNWEKEASHVSADPKGLVNFLRNTGDVLGLVATIGATGNVLGGGGAGVYSRSVVPAISGSVPFFGDMLETATSKYPNSPVKAWVSAITNTAMYAALSQSIFPASKAAQAIKQVEPSVSKVIENLTSGSIKREVARRELQTLTKKAIDFAGGSVLKSAKIAGELTAIGMVDKALDKIMGLDKTAFEQYHPQGQEADTFGSMFLSNLVLGGMVKFGEMKRGNRIVEESLYSAATNPKRFERVIESIDDPSLNKEQMLSNLKFVADTKAVLDSRGVDERNQKRYLFNALKNRIASEERTKLPDENLVRKHDEENKRFGIENDKILNGEDIVGDDIFENNIKTPEGKLLKKAIDSGDMKDRLSAETALKTEGGVDMLLKEIADQALNKIAPDESTKEQSLQRAKEAYGEELTNLAIKKFPGIESSQEPIKEEAPSTGLSRGDETGLNEDANKILGLHDNGVNFDLFDNAKLRQIAKDNGIDIPEGAKNADIIEALKNKRNEFSNKKNETQDVNESIGTSDNTETILETAEKKGGIYSQLAKAVKNLLGGVKTTVTNAFKSDVSEHGDYGQNEIRINNKTDKNKLHIFFHEALHHITRGKIEEFENNPNSKNLKSEEVQAILNLKRIFKNVTEKLNQDAGGFGTQKGGQSPTNLWLLDATGNKRGLANVHEFISEAFTNPEFQKLLKDFKGEGKQPNLFKQFLDAVAKMLGLKDPTILDDIFHHTEKLTEPKDQSLSSNTQKEGGGLSRGDEKVNALQRIKNNIRSAVSAGINKIGKAVNLGFIESHDAAEKLSIEEQHKITQKVADKAREELGDIATFIDKLREKGKTPQEITDFLLKNMDVGGEKSAISANTWQHILDFINDHPDEKATDILNPDTEVQSTQPKDQSLSSNTPSKEQSPPVSGVEGGDVVVARVVNVAPETKKLLDEVKEEFKSSGVKTEVETEEEFKGVGIPARWDKKIVSGWDASASNPTRKDGRKFYSKELGDGRKFELVIRPNGETYLTITDRSKGFGVDKYSITHEAKILDFDSPKKAVDYVNDIISPQEQQQLTKGELRKDFDKYDKKEQSTKVEEQPPIKNEITPKQEADTADKQSEQQAMQESKPDESTTEKTEGAGKEPPTGEEVRIIEDREGEDLSGIKKALVSDEIIKGVDLNRIGYKDAMKLGRKILDTGEVKPEALVTKIITEGKGVLTPTEVVGLITYKRDIDTAANDLYAKYNEKVAAGEDTGTLGVEIANLERQINDFEVMSVITAQQQSLAFGLRQMMLDRDYNAVMQIAKYKKNNNGYIPPEVEAKFRELEKELKDVKAKLTEAEKKQADKEGQESVNNIKESIDREKKYTDEELEKKINEGVESEITKLYEDLPAEKKSAADKAIKALEKFRAKIKSRTYESTLGIPAAIADLGAATAIRAIKIGKTVAAAVEMGINRIKKALKEKGIDKWDKEADYRKDLIETLEGEGVSLKQVKDKPVINEDGTVSIPNKMLRDLVERGVTDINDLTDAVHKEVVKDLPDVTTRQVRDYITEYGKKVNPTADEIQQQVNTAKRVGRLLSELEDLQNKKRKENNPSTRAKLTEKERELKRQISSLEKSGDIPETAEEKNLKRLEKKLNNLLSGEVENTKEKRELSEKENELNDQIADAKKNLGLIRSKNTKTDNSHGLKDLEAKEQSKIKALEKQLSDLKQGVVKEKSEKTEDSAGVKDLKEQIYEAKKNLGLIGSKNTPSTPNQLKITETERKIERLEKEKADLESGIVKQRGVSEKPSPAQQEKIDVLKDEIFELKKNLGVIKSKEIKEPLTEADILNIAKSRVKSRIAELERKIRNKNFAKPVKKVPPTDTELADLTAKKEKLQEEFDNEQYKLQLKNRTGWQKAEDVALEATSGLVRGLVASLDVSATFVQGTFRLMVDLGKSTWQLARLKKPSPNRSLIAIKDMLRSLVSQKYADNYLNGVKGSEKYPLMKASKLAIDDKAGHVSAKEGFFISNWINLIWNHALAPTFAMPISIFTKGNVRKAYDIAKAINPYLASQRAFDGYVNSIRVSSFKDFAKSLENDGYSFEADPKVFQKAADVINTTTGRGSLGAADASSRWLNIFLFAPRKVVSEVKLFTPYAFAYYAKMPKPVRVKALKDLGIFLASFTTANALVWASNKPDEDDKEGMKIWEDFWNPNSSNFLTHKIGDKRVSIGGGAKSMIVFQSRLFTGKFTDQYGKTTELGDRFGKQINTRFDLITNFIAGKSSPIISVGVRKAQERKGLEVDDAELMRDVTVPIWMQDLKEMYKHDPTTVNAILTAFSIFGANVRPVDPSKQSQGNTPKEPKEAKEPKERKAKSE